MVAVREPCLALPCPRLLGPVVQVLSLRVKSPPWGGAPS